jgi:D-alanyl-D-alanine carboxypeptidase
MRIDPVGPGVQGRPNYQLRRLIALTTVFVLAYSAWRVSGSVASAFRAEPIRPRGSGPTGQTGQTSQPPGEPSTTPTEPLAGPPACTFGNVVADDARQRDWAATLLDTQFRLPGSYRPPNLVSVGNAGFKMAGGMVVRSIVIDDLWALRKAAADAGNPLGIVAAYRSFDEQASLFARRKKDLGLEEAERKTARAGHSEHQLGTAIDFNTLGDADVNARWEFTAAGQWMLANAWRFGFIQSYPRGKTSLTCYGNEPWHYRYFGRDVAAAIHQSGLTPREYLWEQSHAPSG